MDPAGFDVVGVGYCSEDTLLLVDRYPDRNSKAEVRRIERSGGGQVATALCALSRLGLKVAFHGRVGDDGPGVRALELLASAGVDVTHAIVTRGVATQQAFIVVDSETRERTIFWRRPRELEMTRHDVDAALVQRARLLHVDGHERGALRALGIARMSGVVTSMDAERASDLARAMLPLVDMLIAAESFPENLLGESDPKAALPRIAALGPKDVVLTLGSRGAIGFVGGETVESPAFPIPDAVDSTGAGDVFHAGFIYAHLRGDAFPEKLRFANAAAGLSLRGLGGRSALPTLSEIQDLIEQSPTEKP
ncbi:MAG: PfkB family carbohydrate kinase [Acidobacteriota bacterium]